MAKGRKGGGLEMWGHNLPPLEEIGLTDLTGPKQVLAANITLFQHGGRLYPP